ncbi:MAG: helix-turn-helix transcriptional regulator [Rhodobiaceae bacterium]|nr:helix-turn-helix transcriptional regulator [Rhodobiaceae bacterium]
MALVEPTTHRSTCPLASTLDLVGDKWSLLIIRDLVYFGTCTFKKFQSAAEKIPAKTLADRLKKLEALGIISKQPYQTRPLRHEYELTEKGLALLPALKALTLWGQAHIDERETIVAVKDGVQSMTRPVAVDLAWLEVS